MSPISWSGQTIAARAAAPRSRPIALIVDHDVGITHMTAMALGSQGWLTIPANTAQEAASIARDLPIDLLVTDLNLPGMSGIELAAIIRAQHIDLPVVIVTGWPEAASLVIEPPFAYLRKPFMLHALFSAVTSLAGVGDGHRLA